MANQVLKAGTIIYTGQKSVVKTLDVVVKGNVRAYNAYCSIDLPIGSIIGIGEEPGSPYVLTYEAAEDAGLFSYPYVSEADLVALYKSNPKLLGTLVAGAVRFTHNLHLASMDCMELARNTYSRVKACEAEYSSIAIASGRTIQKFPEVGAVTAPDIMDPSFGWHHDFIEDLFSNEDKFKKDFYSIPSIGLGMGLTVNTYAHETRRFILMIFRYLDELNTLSSAFMNVYNDTKEALSSKADTSSNEVILSDESVNNCLFRLAEDGNLSPELFHRFRDNLSAFMKLPDRYGSDDESRKLRRSISNDFYDMYAEIFLHCVDKKFGELSLGMRLFLMFGFVDEKLAGSDNTVKMISIVKSYVPDRTRHVFTIFEWLTLIYKGKVMPSKNEFDMDFPTYVKDLKRNGEITDAQEKHYMESHIEKLKFEIKNMFSLGNRVTFGRITTFVPIFDKDNVLKPLEQAFLSAQTVNEQIDRVRNIDFKAFCRQGVYSNPKIGVNSYYLDEEVLPYVILMPNIGSRATLWQEIDGKKRTTPARMIISVFHTENLEDTFTRLIAEFRWEMCKTEQGVHWNDVTDPSLTSLYSDYLQFYRKNSALNQEAKDRISVALKNNSNNFKKVFISDYLTYIKYESQGSLRMNKVVREILFKFCPFSSEIREQLNSNPQFTNFITQYNTHTAQKMKPLQGIIKKLKDSGGHIPDEIIKQEQLLKR